MKISFDDANDVRELANKLITHKKATQTEQRDNCSTLNADTTDLEKNFIVATDGETYFIPEILKLSEEQALALSKEQADASPVCFKTKDGQLLTLFEAWQKKCQEIQFIYNKPLAETLVTVNLNPAMRLDPTFPNCGISFDNLLLDPTITPTQQHYSFNQIRRSLKNKKEDPTTRTLLEKQDVLPNHALRQLSYIHMHQLINDRAELAAAKTPDAEEQLQSIQNELNEYKATLDEQHSYWKEKEKSFYTRRGDTENLLTSEELQQRIREARACKAHYQEKRNNLYGKVETASNLNTKIFVSMLIIGAVIVAGCFFVAPPIVATAMAIIAATIIIGNGVLGSYFIERKLIESRNEKEDHYDAAIRDVSSYETMLLKRNKKRMENPQKYSANKLDDKSDSLTKKCEQIKKQIDVIDPVKKPVPIDVIDPVKKPVPVVPATSFFGKVGSFFGCPCSFGAAAPEENRPLLRQTR